MPPYEFSVPHALALAEDKEMLCVADRENGRIQCFNCHNGSFIVQLHSHEMGSRIFSVAYSPAQGREQSPIFSVGALRRFHSLEIIGILDLSSVTVFI